MPRGEQEAFGVYVVVSAQFNGVAGGEEEVAGESFGDVFAPQYAF